MTLPFGAQHHHLSARGVLRIADTYTVDLLTDGLYRNDPVNPFVHSFPPASVAGCRLWRTTRLLEGADLGRRVEALPEAFYARSGAEGQIRKFGHGCGWSAHRCRKQRRPLSGSFLTNHPPACSFKPCVGVPGSKPPVPGSWCIQATAVHAYDPLLLQIWSLDCLPLPFSLGIIRLNWHDQYSPDRPHAVQIS